MRDAVEKVYGAIDGIDDPLMLGGLVAGKSLFAIDGMAGELLKDDPGDEILGLFVESEFQVVGESFIDFFNFVEVCPEKFARFLRGVDCCFEFGH
jgi:hypothetical protein